LLPEEGDNMTEKGKAKVMLVDDEQDFLQTLTQRLELRGMNVTPVSDGLHAVDAAKNESFDVIILDLSMPGMDGLETLKKIKQDDPDAEIIILTGHGSVKSGVDAIKQGAEDFLEKPVKMEKLLEKIEQAKQKRVLVLQRVAGEKIEEILHSKSW